MKYPTDIIEEVCPENEGASYTILQMAYVILAAQSDAYKEGYNKAISDAAQAVHKCDIKDKEGYRWLCKHVINPLKK